MKNILRALLCAASLAAFPLVSFAQDTFNDAKWLTHKKTLAQLFTVAEEQQERVRALLNDGGLDLRKISLDEVTSTINCLDREYRLLELHGADANLSEVSRTEIADSFKPLIIEEIRQLNIVSGLYRDRVDTLYKTAKKIALPIGVGLSVTGGLLITNMLHITNLDFSTTLLSGILTGGVVGCIVYKDEVKRGVGKAMERVGDMVGIPLDTTTVKNVLKISGAVAGTAVAGAVLYIKRDALKRLLGLKRGKPL